ncbi:hypothetical protein HPB51_021075 [Rhipicephalus microplus]|uniref:Uncharacterized protein n=1 Tax=Rhipicephalus microplus TaxID=6941 RepID=A0A9J6EC00_RHIMP|nr:hypothetical protein HPB51_021075 [Rhipicephalus microplus]
MCIHPTNDTITVSTPDVNHAMAYLKITQVKIADQSCTMAVYAPASDNLVRGIIFNAHSFESDDQIFNELRARNPTINIVSARRLGKTRHFVLTIACHTLPKHVHNLAFTLLIFPFRERVEASFNCRQTGHRTDVCPKPKQDNCHRCGESHPQPIGSKKLTCPAQCVICKGGHLTGSRNCKCRFLKKKLPGNDKSTDKATQNLSDSQTEGTTTDNKSCQESFPRLGGRSTSANGPDNGARSRSPSRTRDHHNRLPAIPHAKSVAWQTDKQRQPQTQPFENQQVRELAEQVELSQQQLAAAKDKIKQLERKQAPASAIIANSTEQIVACAAQNENTATLDLDVVRDTKRRAAEPTAVITTADPNVSQINDRIERLEILFDKMSREQTTQNQQLTESIGALGMALTNLTACLDSLPALTESAATADVITSQTPSSTPTPPIAHKSLKMPSTQSVRATPYSRKDGQRD